VHRLLMSSFVVYYVWIIGTVDRFVWDFLCDDFARVGGHDKRVQLLHFFLPT
jgi:hypothetical protein